MIKAALTAIALTAAAAAQAGAPSDIVQRHTAAGGDLDKLMADYADDAVVFQQGTAIQGKAAIRALYARMFPQPAPGAQRPATPPGGSAGGGMKVTRVWEEGDVGFMTWEAGPMKATEQFLVKDGKIVLQAIYRTVPPAPAPAP